MCQAFEKGSFLEQGWGAGRRASWRSLSELRRAGGSPGTPVGSGEGRLGPEKQTGDERENTQFINIGNGAEIITIDPLTLKG